MKSLKATFKKRWHILIPLILPVIIIEPYVDFFIKVFHAGYPAAEAAGDIFFEGFIMEIIKYPLGIIIRIGPFLFLSFILYLLGKKIPKRLLIPALIGGLAGIYASWIAFTIDFYMPFYGPDPPTDGMYGLILLALPFVSLPYLIEGILLGLLVSLGITLLMDINSDPDQYTISVKNRKRFLISGILLIGVFLFLVFPWNQRTLFNKRFISEVKSENISQERLSMIYKKADRTKNFKMLASIASNPQCPETILSDIFVIGTDSKKIKLLSKLAYNPNTSKEILLQLYKQFKKADTVDESEDKGFVRTLISSDSKDIIVIRSLAGNKSVPDSLLEIMARNPDAYVRSNVAKNNKLPPTVMEILSKDEDSSVRQSLCKNDSIPVKLLFMLQNDQDPYVKRTAKSELKKLGINQSE